MERVIISNKLHCTFFFFTLGRGKITVTHYPSGGRTGVCGTLPYSSRAILTKKPLPLLLNTQSPLYRESIPSWGCGIYCYLSLSLFSQPFPFPFPLALQSHRCRNVPFHHFPVHLFYIFHECFLTQEFAVSKSRNAAGARACLLPGSSHISHRLFFSFYVNIRYSCRAPLKIVLHNVLFPLLSVEPRRPHWVFIVESTFQWFHCSTYAATF